MKKETSWEVCASSNHIPLVSIYFMSSYLSFANISLWYYALIMHCTTLNYVVVMHVVVDYTSDHRFESAGS